MLQTWRAIRHKDLGQLLTHSQTSYTEVSNWEEQIRQCQAYIERALHGQEQLQGIHIPEAEAQIQREEEEYEASEAEITELLSALLSAYGTSLAAHSMLLSV